MLSFYTSFSVAQVNMQDSLALVALYNSTNGANWTNTWDLNQPVEAWYGIEMDEMGFVTIIDLRSNNLNGEISSEIGNLEFLTRIYLQDNQLSGFIPTEIGALISLEQLWLYGNNLDGVIPHELGNLFNLTHIGISHNELTGSLPAELGNLDKLIFLGVKENQLEGCFNFNLKNLYYRLISYNINEGNNFEALWEDFYATNVGMCPISLAQMDSLTLVTLHRITEGENWTIRWTLNDPLETWHGVEINSDRRVIRLHLGNNNLKGRIPTILENLDKLVRLELHTNHLIGNIPTQLGNLSNLVQLWLFNNSLTGNIPASIGNLSNLTHIGVSHNQLTGDLPLELGNLSNLTHFRAKANQLIGNIPSSFGDLASLEDLILHDNRLTGQIPSSIGNLSNLKKLWLYSNFLTGSIPPELGNLHEITHIGVSNNQLTGGIPSELGNLDSLIYFGARKNQLHGTVPIFTNIANMEKPISIEFNEFSHEDISANYTLNSLGNIRFTPQYFGNEQFNTDTINQEVILSPSPRIPYENVNVQWRKDGNTLSDNFILHDTLYIIPAMDTADIGSYEYWFIDSTLTPLVMFQSRPIYNYMTSLDLEGEPILQGKLIVEFGQDMTDKQVYQKRDTLRTLYGGDSIKTCSCHRQIDLWSFGNNIDEVRVFLNGTGEKRVSSTEADGGQNRDNFLTPNFSIGQQIIVNSTLGNSSGEEVIIGTIDTGIKTTHHSVYPNLWRNENEIEGDSIDNDSNGYIDDIYGVDMITFSEMSDKNGHGTHVGGTITANIPNGYNIKLMPVKAFDDSGKGELFDIICAIYYAADNGANIINMSANYKGEKSRILENAIKYTERQGIMFVVSAGNGGENLNTAKYWPARFANAEDSTNVITVTATDATDNLLNDANFGNQIVTIATRGEGIYAPDNSGNESCDYISGTSASAPLVALSLGIEKLKKPENALHQWKYDFLHSSQIDTVDALINDVENGRVLRIEKSNVFVKLKLKVLLEGAMLNDIGERQFPMRTNLNDRGLLPGQTNIGIGNPTPSGQPYNDAIWCYKGTEWGDTIPYSPEIVDWVMVSLREKADTSEIYRTAALLKNDGEVVFYHQLIRLVDVPSSVYIVVEHRNHMPVMSHQRIPIANDTVEYDFTAQNSYKVGTSFGQGIASDSLWYMLGGNGVHANGSPSDINGADKIIWNENNGNFDTYSPADYNMDCDINGNDKKIWEKHNGKTNRVNILNCDER